MNEEELSVGPGPINPADESVHPEPVPTTEPIAPEPTPVDVEYEKSGDSMTLTFTPKPTDPEPTPDEVKNVEIESVDKATLKRLIDAGQIDVTSEGYFRQGVRVVVKTI